LSQIFEVRKAFKPYEYPKIISFKEAIQHSYWLVSEWNFMSDVQDFDTVLGESEKNIIKNCLLAISQIEVSVKEFWGKLGERFPKSEFKQVGYVFAESEVRHADAYSHLLDKLNLNADFEMILQNPVIQGRIDYLTKYLKGASQSSDENFTMNLSLFSLFIENVSLFSQFLIIRSFNKHKNVLKDIDNVISATFREETIHALLGTEIISYIKRENPDWFNDDFYKKLGRACHKAYAAEAKIVDWIFDGAELDFITKDDVKEFIKYRFNESIVMIGGQPVFDIDKDILKNTQWFIEEIVGNINVDFFHKKSSNYSKKQKSFREEDLF